jgi:hypothetical protein
MPTPRYTVVDGQVVNAQRVQERTRGDASRVYLGGFDGAPMNGADRAFISAKMNATVTAMRAAFKVARGKVSVTPSTALTMLLPVVSQLAMLGLIPSAPGETKTAVTNALTALENAYETQVVAGMERVYDGTTAPDRWFEMNRIFVDGIRSILDELKENSTAASVGAFWRDMMNDTSAFLKKFKAGVENTLDYMPIIVGVVGLFAAYTLITQLTAPLRMIAPERKRLNGYRAPRSRSARRFK